MKSAMKNFLSTHKTANPLIDYVKARLELKHRLQLELSSCDLVQVSIKIYQVTQTAEISHCVCTCNYNVQEKLRIQVICIFSQKYHRFSLR